MAENLEKIRSFRAGFPELAQVIPELSEKLPDVLAKLYVDCQGFAEREIAKLLSNFEISSRAKA